MDKKRAKREMLSRRGIGYCTIGCDAWYYVNPRTIDVLIRVTGKGTFSAKLTRRQLQSALRLMSSVE
jgi:hypothetical protein